MMRRRRSTGGRRLLGRKGHGRRRRQATVRSRHGLGWRAVAPTGDRQRLVGKLLVDRVGEGREVEGRVGRSWTDW